jgi:hypothetical protein
MVTVHKTRTVALQLQKHNEDALLIRVGGGDDTSAPIKMGAG